VIVLIGGGTRSRTEGQGFAIQCISHFAMPPFLKWGIIEKESLKLNYKTFSAKLLLDFVILPYNIIQGTKL
jgi:hypothetical protein